jgi:hypothetical protein
MIGFAKAGAMSEAKNISTLGNPQLSDRTIRVFLSSTFLDMMQEREILVKKIFPQLRKLCEERAVTWTEVDLRWGITTEQAAEGRVLPLCLEEIDRCRPYFIGLLGERYGWVPASGSIPLDVFKSLPSMNPGHRPSVTEMEILYGVFNNEAVQKHAYFYFRHPNYVNSLSVSKQPDLVEADTEAASKIEKLKQNIRVAHKEEICELRENYECPEQVGEWILDDFTTLINHLYSKDQMSRGHCQKPPPRLYWQGTLAAAVERTCICG